MFGCYRKADANDPDVYAGAITAVLAEYSQEVIAQVTDPRTGIPRKLKWLPSVAEVSEACEAAKRFFEAKAVVESRPPRIERAVADRTVESDAEMARRFEELKSSLLNGINRVPDAPVVRDDGKHGERVAADLAVREARRA